MEKITVVLTNESGLHARPASLFIKEVSKYKSEVSIVKDGQSYNAKSIMEILNMGASKGDTFAINAEGVDEKKVVVALKKLVESNFGE